MTARRVGRVRVTSLISAQQAARYVTKLRYKAAVRDILPGVNAGASRTAGGIFAGLRYNLFSRANRPALAVEQVYRWLCHTAVTPILSVRTRSYLLPHIAYVEPVT